MWRLQCAKKSNTFILENFFDWKGICIESNPEYFEKLKRARKCICIKECIDGKKGTVDFLCYKTTGGIISKYTDNKKNKIEKINKMSEDHKIIKLRTKTLSQVLKENKAPKIIEFLSLDVEGAETQIMINFPFKDYTFLAMVIERTSKKLDQYFKTNGYSIIKKDPENDTMYLHKSILNLN